MLEHEITHKGHTIAFKRVLIDEDDTPTRMWQLHIDGKADGSCFYSLEDWVIKEAKRRIDNGMV